MPSRPTHVFFLRIVLPFVGGTANAQHTSEEQARAAFQRGVAAMQRRQFAEAITEFELSYGMVPRCSTQFNLAVALEETRRYADSLTTLARYQSECAANMPAANAAYVLEALPRLAARVGTLTLRLQPPSAVATVSVDNRLRSDWNGDIALDPGSHTVLIRTREGQVIRREVSVTEGARETLSLSLETSTPSASPSAIAADSYGYGSVSSASPPVHPEGSLRIDSPIAHARVTVDGQELGEVPVTPTLSSGRHQVEVQAEGFRTARLALSVQDGRVTRLSPRLEREETSVHDRPFYTRWWFWTLVGGAVVAGAAAVVYVLTRPADDVVYTFQALHIP
jgi:hypothetical protein